jgi:ABC-type dipeptide/oligopeptide/nickel transport system permease subunit
LTFTSSLKITSGKNSFSYGMVVGVVDGMVDGVADGVVDTVADTVVDIVSGKSASIAK